MKDKEKRVLTAIVFISLAIVAGIFNGCFRGQIFYPEAKNSVEDSWRLLWLVPFLFGGLAYRAWRWREYPGSPWLAYFWKYPIWLAAGSLLVFAAFHSFLGLDSWLYYPTSALIAYALALAPGNAWLLVLTKISRAEH